ncbi:callose synthase 11-like [Lycium barbarum]|uniref:callose synthase 11-like n=1 Tax=Lycium barbarum TaxID=112863 RepID=UPI00293F3CB3|nr:callose synthase 11-like [Lycium barbarum]XP_060191460.1 callose synthase 11-like [Lycium barbarum]XP_060191461.1 callose synthase 11-like [Lycium barbarum]XP_060191462.1 callose synthase 11-like [Lycium barbarum]XP_060191463.1 callose synthase 11-like [Lycium barbarum]XP_060191464.1 callose synthase 11-like [Lycium barbarum]XP_060191465.1 callose synthase 11-like [Lycium barbarum]XP_060191466.1 callose synthase 11-like [Lycium barbarum]
MNLRQRPPFTRGRGDHARPRIEPYNIIPIHNLLADHPSLRYPEVRAASAALRAVGDLPLPPFMPWGDNKDLMDWLGQFFGFQDDNVKNQRENLVLHLANAQMRIHPPLATPDRLDYGVLRQFRQKLLKNYSSWCSYLGKKSQVKLPRRQSPELSRRELLYVCLYLLIWGEAANLRFAPECLCYIYHHMAMEMNYIVDGHIDENTGQAYVPFTFKQFGFLDKVVTPIYNTIRDEVKRSRNGTAPHSAWRNYDDINEYFWTRKCFRRLKWPLDLSSAFLDTTVGRRVGKTGFVEQRTFWNIFRSFDRLWVLLILFFQAAVIVAWQGTDYPWQALEKRDVQVQLLTIFITWAGLRFIQSILDAGTQYSLVSRDTMWIGVRMVLKSIVAVTWAVVFGVFYARIWRQRNSDRRWSYEANQRIFTFLEAALVFVAPELLALVLFILPWLRNVIEKTNWPIFYLLTWWFHTRIFVGRGLREGLINNIKYTLFWIAVLASKFVFSYAFQIRPLLGPTRALLNIKNAKYKWREFFGSTNELATVLLWIPVVLIYLVDLQIWYTIYSAIVGGTVGLFSHIGEIRNIKQLRLRFQFFASAMQFNLMPEIQTIDDTATLVHKLRNAIHRIKLRYGLGSPYKKIESSQVDATRFALIWNEIIITLREEDFVSDHELELMELPPNCWDIKVIRWPCFLLCNELLLALSHASELADAPDGWVWFRICKNEYRRCAVIEAYDSIKYLLLEIIKYDTEEHSIVTALFHDIDDCIHFEKFTKAYKMTLLPRIHEKLVSLIELLLRPEPDLRDIVNVLQALYEVSVREFPRVKKRTEQLMQEGLAPTNPDTGLLFENVIEFPDIQDAFFYRQLRRLQTILTSRDSMQYVPRNKEARRRIAFFSNSLFMNMPRAPQVEKMMAFSVLTPYYDEEVLFGKESLRSPNEDGVSTIFYLQRIYDDEWENFMERMRKEGMQDEEEIWNTKSREIRQWASYRGQTLSRTVRGMMYYYKALKMLSFLDSASEVDIRHGSQEIASLGSLNQNNHLNGLSSGMLQTSRNLHRSSSSVTLLFKGHELGAALMKFTYVVTCQVYGSQKKKGDRRAEEILNLMKHNEALRIAYVDEVYLGRNEVEYYSVLVKYDQQLKEEVEIYRIKLPGPLKLGEGKPENQNHAIIFTRGEAVQTIDMNQDNYFEEALKMRNLLEEFKENYGIRKPTILGVRENIFTGSVSSLAWFMSAQETSFVTLGQRVLADPLKVRMHYGHPDVFDRFWFLSRGGISKASKVINISEDIFAGFNCTLRGGNVTHHEYIQVGKGRDVGLNQIAMFEAKVASGNGEQVLSRDVYRLGHRLDFFRMLSFFYTTVGFFFNNMIVVVMVFTFLWGRLYLALSGVEEYASRNASNNKALGSILNQQFVIQLGLFTALPMIVENSLEHGFLPAVWDFVTMQLQLASLFFTYSMGTRAHFFGRTILHGGAKYRATGRGFVVERKSFGENYRLYSRSHFVKAIELGVILVVYASHSPVTKDTFVYIAMTISSWFLVVSWITSPFVFNPSGFDWLKTVYDFDDFMHWIWYNRGVFEKADHSWETWWYEEQDHLRTTGLWGKLLEIILDLRFFFFQYGIVYQLRIAGGKTSIGVYLLSWIIMVAVVAIYIAIAYAKDKYAMNKHIYYRMMQLLVILLTVLVIAMLLRFTRFTWFDLITSLLAFIPTGWGLIQIAVVLRPFLQSTLVWSTVVSLARLYDMMLGLIVMAPLALLSWMPGFQSMQTRILFNEAFSRGLQISRILTGKTS